MSKSKNTGKPFVVRKHTIAITHAEAIVAVVEGIPNMAGSSHDHVFAVTEKTSLTLKRTTLDDFRARATMYLGSWLTLTQ